MNSAGLNSLSDHILATIRRRPSHFFTIRHLAKKFSCQPADIIGAVEILCQAGYDIAADKADRIAFVSAPDALLSAEITNGLKTSFIGKTVYAYKSVQSTNILAAKLADVNAPEGAIVVAESQTKGRGRLGRAWHSPEGKGIYISIILYPPIEPPQAPGISLMTALSLADTIAACKPKNVAVKWPNDCLINGRKVAGILTELSADMDHINHVIIGIGINVNHRRKDFPDDLAKTATSLRHALKTDIRRVEFLQKFLLNLEKDYKKFKKSGLRVLHKRILNYSNLIGRPISINSSGEIISGTAVDINENGNLVVETPAGPQTFIAGEVTIVKGRRQK
jgi:BirA family biotin operon repressor/biotin-[acetyl-CoA-carboxylase] ligase